MVLPRGNKQLSVAITRLCMPSCLEQNGGSIFGGIFDGSTSVTDGFLKAFVDTICDIVIQDNCLHVNLVGKI